MTSGAVPSAPSFLRFLLGWVALFFSLVSLPVGTVQAATYAYRNQAFSYDLPSPSATLVSWHTSGAAPACTNYPNGDDDWADVSFPAGFQFTFGGTSYAGVRIYSNGILAFGNDVSGFHRDYTPQALPITSAAGGAPAGCPNAVPVNLMLPYWIDIVAGTANNTTGASVKYELLGTAPNRRFVISWVNVKLYNQTARYNFQVVLYESSAGSNGNFEYRYSSGSSNGLNATVGVQLTTTDYTQYSYNQQFIDTTNGTAILWYPANQLATKSAEYRFDESVWSGVAAEVKDTSGNSRDGQRVGNATNIAAGKLCRGGSFTNNTSNAVIDAVATPLVPGQSGSIDFWYRSNNAWNVADGMLIDATAVANRPFFLMKRGTGALRFALADSAGTVVTADTGSQNFPANSWQHIGITWNVRPGTNQTLLQIFINGNLAAYARGTTNGTLPSLSSIYIGDNRTSGVTPNNGTPNGANGTIDEVYIYPIDVSGPQFQADMALTRPVCTALDHFRIIHDGTASCGAAQVTIEAHDGNHALFSLAGSTMTISTSTGHGSWSAVSAINAVVNTGPGTATYTFANESRIVLALSNPYAETLNIDVSSGSITEHSGVASSCSAADYTYGNACDANLTFAPCVSSFECLESGLPYQNLTANPTARNPLYTKLAGATLSFDVVAVDVNGNRATSYAADADKTVTVELVDGSGSAACVSRAALNPAVTTTLTFAKTSQPTEQGRKTVSLTVSKAYPNLRCRVTDASLATPVVGCSSDNFAIRPAGFTLSSSNANADAGGGSTTATPAIKAGSSFSLTATAVPGYGGTPQIDSSKLVAHTGSVATGSLSGSFPAADPASGSATGTAFAYGEVGYFRFDPGGVYDAGFTAVDQPNDCSNDFSNSLVGGKYGCMIGNPVASDFFGRFIPDHFDTVATAACGSFTYSGQPFPLTVTAKNLGGGTTQNYAGAFAKTVTLSDANGATGAFSPASLAAGDFPAGEANKSVKFTFAGKPAAPATLKVRATDGEASSATGSEGSLPLRSGRLRLVNYYGSELLRPRVEYRVEYWDGSRWTVNAADTCTSLAAANIATGGLAAPSVGALFAGIGFITFNTAPAGSYDIAANLNAAGSDTSCNAAHGGTAANLPWLQGDWSASCGGIPPWQQDPSARVRLGSPKAPYIYLRERY